jgi:hypothetical protein
MQSNIKGLCIGTRLWAHEVNLPVKIGQQVTPARGPFAGRPFAVVGQLSNRFDTFVFVLPMDGAKHVEV